MMSCDFIFLKCKVLLLQIKIRCANRIFLLELEPPVEFKVNILGALLYLKQYRNNYISFCTMFVINLFSKHAHVIIYFGGHTIYSYLEYRLVFKETTHRLFYQSLLCVR